MTERKNPGIRFVADFHNCIVQASEGADPHLSANPPTIDEFKILDQSLTLGSRVRLYTLLDAATPSAYSSVKDEDCRKLFHGYNLNDETRDGLAKLKLLGGITICSSSPDTYQQVFKGELEKQGIWQLLNPNYPVFLRKKRLIYNNQTIKVPPILYKTQVIGEVLSMRVYDPHTSLPNLYYFEDDYNIAKFIASRFTGINIYMPISESEAKSQPQMQLPIKLSDQKSPIYFNQTIGSVASVLTNSIYHYQIGEKNRENDLFHSEYGLKLF